MGLITLVDVVIFRATSRRRFVSKRCRRSPSTFLLPGIEIVTIIQDDPTTESLLLDSISYCLSK